jgi:hypothetical protein
MMVINYTKRNWNYALLICGNDFHNLIIHVDYNPKCGICILYTPKFAGIIFGYEGAQII